MSLRTVIKRIIPLHILNRTLLTFPSLYRTRAVLYETNIGSAVEELLAQIDLTLQIEGDIVECGSARCGTSILIAEHLRSRGVDKKVYAYDSFKGFDLVELAAERHAGLTEEGDDSFTRTSYAYVREKIRRLGFEGSVIPVQGYFQETLPATLAKTCCAFIDCDLRESVSYCAEQLWPHIPSRGRIIFDDYMSHDFRGARFGVEDFIERRRNEISEHGLIDRFYYICKS